MYLSFQEKLYMHLGDSFIALCFNSGSLLSLQSYRISIDFIFVGKNSMYTTYLQNLSTIFTC